MQRKARRRSSAEPFARLDPGRMRRAIVIPEPVDFVGIELDSPRRRAQLVRLGIGAKISEQHIFVGSQRYFDPPLSPERLEIANQVALCSLAEIVVEVM